jgi:HAMP domain-containing protein
MAEVGELPLFLDRRSSPGSDVWALSLGDQRGPGLPHLLAALLLALVGSVVGTLGLISLPPTLWLGGFGFALALQVAGGVWFGAWGVLAAAAIGLASGFLNGDPAYLVWCLLPSNVIQGFFTGWVFRRWKFDPTLPTRRDLLAYVMAGPLASDILGRIMAEGTLFLAGHPHADTDAAHFLAGRLLGNSLPSLLLGVFLMRALSPHIMDSPFFCKRWWGGAPRMKWPRRFEDIPLAAKLLMGFSLAGIVPMLLVAAAQAAFLGLHRGIVTAPLIAAMVNASVFLTLIVAGTAALRIRERLRTLSGAADRLGRGDLSFRVPDLGADELGTFGSTFNHMAEELSVSREELRASTEAQARDRREMEIAREIQQAFLPEKSPDIPGLAVAAASLPARVVGGDFYDFVPMAGGRWGVLIADVSGKGVPAALLTTVSRNVIRTHAQAMASPAAVLASVNQQSAKGNTTRMYVTCALVVLDPADGSVTYANAGHNPPFLLPAGGGPLRTLPATGTPLALLAGMPYKEAPVEVASGDTLLLYTDGVTEAMGPGDELFGEERLEAVMREHADRGPEELVRAIMDAVHRFAAGRPPSDDLTLVALRWS